MMCDHHHEILITVVIPTYNRGRYIARAVESVLAQSHERLECIVVDDGSTDETREVLRRLQTADSRVSVLYQSNNGVSAARNRGIAYAIERGGGQWIALLDSDDCWLERKLEIQLDFMLRSGLEACQTEEIWMRNGKRVNPMRKHRKKSGRFFAEALELCMVSPSCVMFSNAFWNSTGPFDERLRACEDYDLWLRALLHFDIGLVPQPLTVRHGGRPDQLSAQIVGQDLFRIYSLRKLLRMRLDPEQRRLVRDVLRRKTRVYTQGCIKHGRVEEALRVQELVRCDLA